MTSAPRIVVVALAAVVLLLRHQYLCLRSLDTYQVVVREGKERVGRDFHTVTLHRSVAGTEPTNLAQTIATTVVMVATTSIGWSKATWLLVGRKGYTHTLHTHIHTHTYTHTHTLTHTYAHTHGYRRTDISLSCFFK